VVGDVMGQYHPHGDTAIYDTLVRLAQPWVMRAPLIHGQGNFGSPGNDSAAAMRYTECRMAPLALEMVRDIEQDTGRLPAQLRRPLAGADVLPSRYPNLLVNGSAGIAGRHGHQHPAAQPARGGRRRPVGARAPRATREELQDALIERIKGPDFPNGALIVGREGIEQAYRTGRGSVTQRAVIEVDEDNKGRTCLSITELPYMVNPDNLALKIAELADTGKVQGIADVATTRPAAPGQRLVVGAQARSPVRASCSTTCSSTPSCRPNFSANMLALVDGRAAHADAATSSSQQLGRPPDRGHPAAAPATGCAEPRRQAPHLPRPGQGPRRARRRHRADPQQPRRGRGRDGADPALDIDEEQARRDPRHAAARLAALKRQKIIDGLARLETAIATSQDILANEARQRQIVGDELGEIVDKYGDDRRTQIIAADGDLSMEDLIPDEELVVTITRGGYAKRTRADQYRTQKRGGKGVRGATLRGDDVVEHFMATSNHHWLLFFTTAGRVYRTKAYNLPEAQRDAKGGHVAGLLSFQPDEQIAQVLAIRDYEQAPYLVLACRSGLVKKTRLGDYNSPRQAGVIAINFRQDDDELIGAELVDADDDILLVSRKGQAIRFRADDTQLRPMGRATSGVQGMKFRDGDDLLSMSVIRASQVAASTADAARPAAESDSPGSSSSRT
jgi:DNA gyrase subunit A